MDRQITLVALLALALPVSSYGENGTFNDCVDAFVEQYAHYVSDLEYERVLASCSLPGKGNNVGSELQVEIYSLAQGVPVGLLDLIHIGIDIKSNVNGQPKGCSIRQWKCDNCVPAPDFSNVEWVLMNPVSISLNNRDAKKWTQFVKREACSIAKSGL